MALRVILAAVFLSTFLSLAFLTGQGKANLTLTECVAVALRQNPEISVARNEVAKADAAIGQAWSAVLPKVDGFATLQHSWEIQTSRIPNFLKPMLGPLGSLVPGVDQMPDFVNISFGLENTLRYGVTLTQPIFLGGAGKAGIDIAHSGRRISGQELRAKQQQVVFDAALAFYSCLLAREMTEVQSEALNQAKENLAIVVKRFEVGAASPFDKMRAEVEVAAIEPEVISARNAYTSSITRLRMVLGVDSSVLSGISGSFVTAPDSLSRRSVQELQLLAYVERPELSQIDEQKSIALGSLSLARSNYLPKVIFQTEYSYLGARNDLRFAGDDLSKGFNSTLVLQLPLFSGFETSNMSERASLDVSIASETERRARNGISAEVEVALNALRQAEEKLQATRRTLELATEALRLATVMYEEGGNTQLDVLNSRMALTRTRLNHANTSFEYEIARYQLRKATGTLEGVL